MIKAVFFDLFFTLIYPKYSEKNNEYDVLKITPEEWEQYAEDDKLYNERALGKVKTEEEIIEKIAAITPFYISDIQKTEIIINRENRMKNALMNVDEEILHTLKELKKQGLKICLVSNADIIDCKFWSHSPLSQHFDDAVFSCNVEMLKPDTNIYKYAMDNLNVDPSESLFIGDGGSDELRGAKSAGMQTAFTEYLYVKGEDKRKKIMQSADYCIKDFKEILTIIKN